MLHRRDLLITAGAQPATGPAAAPAASGLGAEARLSALLDQIFQEDRRSGLRALLGSAAAYAPAPPPPSRSEKALVSRA